VVRATLVVAGGNWAGVSPCGAVVPAAVIAVATGVRAGPRLKKPVTNRMTTAATANASTPATPARIGTSRLRRRAGPPSFFLGGGRGIDAIVGVARIAVRLSVILPQNIGRR
jgi:hypothetical protein